MKFINLIIALLCFAGLRAASITHTATIFPTLTDWSLTNSVPQFDPALGTLNSVSISIGVNASTEIFVENRDRREWPTTAGSEVTATATVAGFSAVASVTNLHSQTLTAFDGVLDFGGTSGFTQAVVGTASASAFAPSVLFIGVGNVPLVASADAVGRYNGSGAYRFVVGTTASAIVTVTYDFTPNCPPAPTCNPEPEDCVKPPTKDDDCDDDRRKPSRRNRR
jgi:hypothetical protein